MVKLRTIRGMWLAVVAVLAFGGALFFAPEAAHAIPSLQCRKLPDNDDDDGDGDDDDTPPEVTHSCDSTEATIKYYLKQAGYDDNAVAGIMGNLSAESCGYRYKVVCSCGRADVDDSFKAYTRSGSGYKLNSTMTTNCGFGLVQWTPDSNPSRDRLLRLQKYADGQGKSVTNLKVQIAFILRELTTTEINAYYYNVLRPEKLNGRSLKDVVWRVEKWYESPGSVRGSPGYGEVSKVCQDASSSWCKSFKKRLERAQEALKVPDCVPGDEQETPDGDGESPEPTPVIEDDDDSSGDDSQPPTITTDGALGKQSAGNAISQTDGGVKNTPWLSRSNDKKIGIYDNGNCCGSGCSLIAVANAYGAIHDYSKSQVESFANTLASWAKGNIYAPSEANTVKMISHAKMSYKKVWSSKSTSESTKIAAIRAALSSGGAIVAGGDRAGTGSDFCTSTRLSNGECAFTPGGHYIAIIGITADNKLVVANPGKSNGRNWIFPASNILKYSNIGYSVK